MKESRQFHGRFEDIDFLRAKKRGRAKNDGGGMRKKKLSNVSIISTQKTRFFAIFREKFIRKLFFFADISLFDE